MSTPSRAGGGTVVAMKVVSELGLAALLLCACGDDTVFGGGDTEAGGDGATTVADTGPGSGPGPGPGDTTGPPPADGSTDDDGSTTATLPPPQLPYAGDIRLVRMTANQAVQVELYADDVELTPDEYNTRLIPGRRTLLRGFWSLHADFEPRELIGRLVVDYPDGTQLTQDYPLMVDSNSGDGGKSFQWLLEPDQVVEGMRYRARILEAAPDVVSGTLSDPPPIAPLAGRGTIGLYDAQLQMKVVLIPVLHQFDGCEQAPDITDDDVTAMRRQLEQNNPVQFADLQIGEPMPYTDPIGTSGGGFSPVLSALAMRREMDAPDPNVYYYGLLDPCDGYPPGLLGQAIGIPPQPTQELASLRISTGRWNGSGENAAETFVHEVGHTQGRRHVTCTGGEGGPDANYPHPNGRIGVWGFGIYDFELRTPTGGRDYMTYCSNEWVSDYAWEQTLEIIETLTSWDFADGAPTTAGPALLGAQYPDGTQDWWTGHAEIPASIADSGDRVRWESPDGIQSLRAWVYTRPDSRTTQIIAPLPDGFAGFASADTLAFSPTAGPAEAIDVAAVAQLATP